MSYVRCSILGTLVSSEKWSINLTFDPTGEFPGGVSQSALDAAALAIAGLSVGADLQGPLGASGTLNACRLEVRDDIDDHLIGLSEQNRPTPLVGASSVKLTAQSAIVCSIRTDSPGASGRGRVYWPAMGVTIDGNSRMSSPTNTNMVAAFKTYFAAMETQLETAFPTIGFSLAVRSRATHSTPHATRIQVGNVLDTQRRRRDALPEAYATLAYP